MSNLRLAGVVRQSIVDGPGLRMTVFVQGCPHHCQGCHNPQTHDFQGGYEGNIDNILAVFADNPLLQGITFSGGEPMCQAEALLPLAVAVKDIGKDIVIFTGYLLEDLLVMGHKNEAIIQLLQMACLLIDGPFIEAQKDLSLTFRGSSNQRLLDSYQSVLQGQAVWASRYQEA